MKARLLPCLLLLSVHQQLTAQVMGVYDGDSMNVAAFGFEYGDSLRQGSWSKIFEIDTAGCRLWQIGRTQKPFFANPGQVGAIMTDTAANYGPGADESFILKIPNAGSFNTIISFRHKYKASSGEDGGLIEFSTDSGQSWENVRGDCYSGHFFPQKILLSDFYGATDTLKDGEPAFTGQGDWQYSRLQFFDGFGVKGNAGCDFDGLILLRFRFRSEGNSPGGEGWIIDRINVENDRYTSVEEVSYRPLAVRPNPAASGVFFFPELPAPAANIRIRISDVRGALICDKPYRKQLHLQDIPDGLYFYDVTTGRQRYRGKLRKGL